MVQISKQVVSDVESKDTDSNFLYWLQNSNYLTGALWPVSSKAIQFAKSAILSAHSSCRAKRGGILLDVLCPCLRCTVRHCQIQNNLAQVQLAERQVALLGFIGLPC